MGIRILITSKVKDGMTDEWKDLAAKMTDAARTEPGTTLYRWYLNDSGLAINDDVYEDEAAFFAHFGAATGAGNIEAWMNVVDITHVAVLDPVNAEMTEALEAFGAVHYAMPAGF